MNALGTSRSIVSARAAADPPSKMDIIKATLKEGEELLRLENSYTFISREYPLDAPSLNRILLVRSGGLVIRSTRYLESCRKCGGISAKTERAELDRIKA